MGKTSSLTPMFRETGYVEKTTFGMDFDIADAFGEQAIKNTYERALKEWKNNYKFFTELVMVLNYKCWQWYYRGNQTISKLYADLYYKADEYANKMLYKLYGRNTGAVEFFKYLEKEDNKVSFYLSAKNWPEKLHFIPYFKLHNQRYGIYWII